MSNFGQQGPSVNMGNAGGMGGFGQVCVHDYCLGVRICVFG
jgi:hypothetical protein